MIIHRYILKNHAWPFVFSVITLIAVFLLQFLMKFADRLIGKGLSTWVIVKLISYNLAWMVVLVVPMSVLIATLMAFGSMAQNNEVAVLKSSGMSLYRMMIAPMLASIVIAYLLVLFNNHVYPNANHAARIMLQDISRKKPTLSLVPGVFSQEVKDYSILARQIDPKTNELHYVTIYDYSDRSKLNIVSAKDGRIYFSKDQKKLIMDLRNGEIHQSDLNQKGNYRIIKFKKHRIAMEADNFSFQQSSFGGPRGDRELGAPAMLVIVDSLSKIRKSLEESYQKTIKEYFSPKEYGFYSHSKSWRQDTVTAAIASQNRLNTMKSVIYSRISSLDFNKKNMNRYWVEIYKKYAIPVACIVFILIGAPLGTMARRGGLGVAAGLSLVFFLIYWAFLIGGEKLADRGLFSPFWGIWSANIFLGILGIYLTVKSAREKVTLDFSFILKLIPKNWKYETEDN